MIGKVVKVDLEEFQERLAHFNKKERKKVLIKATNDLGNAVMSKARELSPVGDYSNLVEPYNARMGGTMRAAWQKTPVSKKGEVYRQTVKNPIEYARYVEYGHKQTVGRYVPALGKRLKQGFVKGQYMLTKAVIQTNSVVDKIVKNRIDKELKKVFKNG